MKHLGVKSNNSDVAEQQDLTGGTPTTLTGLINLLHNDETSGTEIVNSTTESSALKTYNLPANSYSKIKIEAIITARSDADANNKTDFTFRIKSAGSTVATFAPRSIASSTTAIDGGNRYVETVSTIINGGQGSITALTITGQNSVANATIGCNVLAFRVYGIRDVNLVGLAEAPVSEGSVLPLFSKGFVFDGYDGRYYRSLGEKDGGLANTFHFTSPESIGSIFNISNPFSGFVIAKTTTITNIRLDYSTVYAETYKCYLVVKRFPSGVETNSLLWTSADLVTTANSAGSLNVTGLSISLTAGDRIFVVTLRTASTEGGATGIALSMALFE